MQHQLRQSIAFLEALKTAAHAEGYSSASNQKVSSTNGKSTPRKMDPQKKRMNAYEAKVSARRASLASPSSSTGIFKLMSPLSTEIRQTHPMSNLTNPLVGTRLSTPALPDDLQFAGWKEYAFRAKSSLRFDAEGYRARNEAMIVLLEEGIRASEAAMASH